jgi:hypothetical protein
VNDTVTRDGLITSYETVDERRIYESILKNARICRRHYLYSFMCRTVLAESLLIGAASNAHWEI